MNPIEFTCTQNKKTWQGKITKIIDYGSHTELRIASRSGITVIIGETQAGNFCCIPDWQAGCHLADLSDSFWNYESLYQATKNKVDAMTVAKALHAYYENLEAIQ